MINCKFYKGFLQPVAVLTVIERKTMTTLLSNHPNIYAIAHTFKKLLLVCQSTMQKMDKDDQMFALVKDILTSDALLLQTKCM